MKLMQSLLIGLVATGLGLTAFSAAASAAEVVIRHASNVKISEPQSAKPADINVVEQRVVRPIRLISIVEPRQIVRPTVVVRDRPVINVISPDDDWQAADYGSAFYTPPIIAQVGTVPLFGKTTWQNDQTLNQSAGWISPTFAVNQVGRKLVLAVDGTAQINKAQVEFGDGEVQTIKLSDQPYQNGEFLLVDFGTKRQVQSVQIVGRSDSPQSQLDLKLRA